MLSDRPPVILTIEDKSAVRDSTMAYLDASGFRTLSAETGPEGLEIFRRDRPDVVLLDLRLPGMDGQDVLRAIREESPDAAVIVLSGKGLMADVIAAFRLGRMGLSDQADP